MTVSSPSRNDNKPTLPLSNADNVQVEKGFEISSLCSDDEYYDTDEGVTSLLQLLLKISKINVYLIRKMLQIFK